MEKCDVAIIGAGPYGLSAGAHLSKLNGLDVRIFGEPMSFWQRYMPVEMMLRSPWAGSHICDPENRLTLDFYKRENGTPAFGYPIPITDFINYGLWFQEQIAIPTDQRKVVRTDIVTNGYELTLQDGDTVHARRVVIAGGIQPFVNRPKMFDNLPESLVTHTSEQREFGKFRNKQVLVIGGGQSALEAAAFLHAAGARAEVMIRNRTLHWLGRAKWVHSKLVEWAFYGRADVGPAGISLVVQRPNVFRRLPRSVQVQWGKRAIRPAVSERLEAWTRHVPIHTGRFVSQAEVKGEHLRIQLNDGSERIVDHLILGTGYRVDVTRYPFLSSEVLDRLELVDGYPRLDSGFESSLPGLHFLGAPAAWSFGPLLRFVAGTEFASPKLAKRVLRGMKRCPAPRHYKADFVFDPFKPDTGLGHTQAGASRSPGKQESLTI